MAKHKGHGHHTGPIRHHDMTSLVDGPGEKDPHASAEHHAKNKEYGMEHGCCCEGDESGEQEGGKGMEGNACYE